MMTYEQLAAVSEYRTVDAINYSTLSKLDAHPSMLQIEEPEEVDALTFGSLVDDLMFVGREYVDKCYVAHPAVEITDGIKNVIDIYMSQFTGTGWTNKDQLANELLAVARTIGYQSNYKDDTLKGKLLTDDTLKYIVFLLKSKGKKIVSPEQMEMAEEIVPTLLTHKFTNQFFKSPGPPIEIIVQKPIYFDAFVPSIGKAQFKILPDMLVIHHGFKSIIAGDLKTTYGYASGFSNEYIRWRYYLQGSLYLEGIKAEYPGYKTGDFRFVVVGKKDITTPLVFKMSDNDIQCGKHGGIIRGRAVKGWQQLADDLLWHKANDSWQYAREHYISNGVVQLQTFESNG